MSAGWSVSRLKFHVLAESEVLERPSIPVLVNLRASFRAGVLTPAVRELQVGCIRSTHTSKKVLECH